MQHIAPSCTQQDILQRRSRQAAVAEAQMQTALAATRGGGGVTWGMAEDAVEEVDEFGTICAPVKGIRAVGFSGGRRVWCVMCTHQGIWVVGFVGDLHPSRD